MIPRSVFRQTRRMAVYSTNEFKSGLKILLDGDPYAILENEYVKPGKGQAFNRVKIRNLKTGRVVERTFKSGDTAEGADVVDQDMQYLYTDGQFWYFMVPDTFEQIAAGEAAVADAKPWMKEQESCIVTLWDGVPLYVAAPNHVELKIVETDPGVRGDTATGGQKPAKLETGADGARAAVHQRRRSHQGRYAHGHVHLARQAVTPPSTLRAVRRSNAAIRGERRRLSLRPAVREAHRGRHAVLSPSRAPLADRSRARRPRNRAASASASQQRLVERRHVPAARAGAPRARDESAALLGGVRELVKAVRELDAAAERLEPRRDAAASSASARASAAWLAG